MDVGVASTVVMSAIHIARRIAIITIFARLSWCAILIGLRRHVARLAFYR
jgi:Asp/Glu/hydantoin racemase